MSEVKTKFANGRNPFTGKSDKWVDPTRLELVDDPVPRGRVVTRFKYDELFSQAAKTGQAIKCSSEDTPRISAAAQHYLRRFPQLSCSIKSTRNYGDGKGRVWFIKKEKIDA